MTKHQPYKKNSGKWSCRICRWEWQTRPNKDNCPEILRIEQANDEYKTQKQWLELGYRPVVFPGHVFPVTDAISIVHSTNWYRYFHKSHVVPIDTESELR